MKVLPRVLLTLGFLDSAYLFYTDYLTYTSAYCPVNCLPPAELVVPSYVFAILGLFWFLAGIALTFVGRSAFIKAWKFLGIAGVAFLFSYSLAIQYYCPYCYLAHALAVASMISWRSLKSA